MIAALQYATGLGIIHVAWAIVYLVGSIAWTPRLGGPPPSRRAGDPGAVLEFVLTTVAGMAIAGLTTFFIGIAGALYPIAAAIAVACLFGAFILLGESPFTRAFWALRWRALTALPSAGAIAVYLCTLFLAVPAILPETAYDALFYHLPYALDWATTHHIYADEWRRWPYYANNWLLLDAWLFEFGATPYVDFLGWFAGALSLLGVYGLVDALGERFPHLTRPQAQLAAFLSTLALLVSPIFVRWVDTGMVDAAIGLFFIASVASVVMAVQSGERRWAYYLVVCFAFFVGIKGSFLAFIPCAMGAVWIAMRASRQTARVAAIAAAITLLLCLPWYAKNFIQTGDPVDPFIKLALHQPDSKWTPADMSAVMGDVRGDQSARFLIGIPVDIILHPDSHEYREVGVTLLMFFVFLPGMLVGYGLLRGKDALLSTWFVFALLISYAVAFWLMTTHLGRYSMLFYPALAAFIGYLALWISREVRAGKILAFGLLICVAIPTPGGAVFLDDLWQKGAAIDKTFAGSQAYLTTYEPGYAVEEYTSQALRRTSIPEPRVYTVGDEHLDYYYQLHGVLRVGDWFGRERYGDFATAIETGKAVDFLRGLRIDAVVIGVAPAHPLLPLARIAKLEAQLAAAGYTKTQLNGDNHLIYLAPGVAS
jgi:hypothetical protein